MTIRSLGSGEERDEEHDLGDQGANSSSHPVEPLTAENMLWANTVLAAGTAVGAIVYTGRETRAVMNTSQPGTKTGLLDEEINRLAKVRQQLHD
jgi:phospholipid-translocating ATPase